MSKRRNHDAGFKARVAEFCIEALEDAFRLHGRPEILNTDSHQIDASSRVV